MSDYRIEAATKEEWAERAFAAEERLAKAMMALEGLLTQEPDWPSSVWVNARTIITEIKGGKDDWSNVWPNVDDFYRPLPRKEKKDENENDTPTTSE